MPETPPTSNRITLYNHTHYKVDLEYNEEFAILHLPEVRTLKQGVIADMQKQLCDFATFLKINNYNGIWAAINPSNTRTVKLAKMFGFEYQGSSDGFDVFYLREV